MILLLIIKIQFFRRVLKTNFFSIALLKPEGHGFISELMIKQVRCP